MPRPCRPRRTVPLAVAGLLLAACGSGRTVTVATPVPVSSSVAAASSASVPATPTTSHRAAVSASRSRTVSATPSHPASPSRTSVSASPSRTAVSSAPSGSGPVIVVDPGHAPTTVATDPATGLNVSDYENEPEMRDVFAVALLVKAQLQAAGYRVVLTKNTADARVSLGQRAAIANSAHAALAISIHDQAGSNGGIPFATGNNIVYYQAVGDYRATAAGHKVYFTDAAEAAISQRYGGIFRSERSAIEGHSIRLQGDVGYDLGSRGLAPGNIWIVQLLSKVPWIYNEAGGNSPGQAGLDSTDQHRYAAGLVAGIEHCVPIAR